MSQAHVMYSLINTYYIWFYVIEYIRAMSDLGISITVSIGRVNWDIFKIFINKTPR